MQSCVGGRACACRSDRTHLGLGGLRTGRDHGADDHRNGRHGEHGRPAPGPGPRRPDRDLKRRAIWLKLVARKLSKLTQHPRPTVSRTRGNFDSLLRYRLWRRDAWKNRAEQARFRAHHPPHLAAWRCIHRTRAPGPTRTRRTRGGSRWTSPSSGPTGGELLRRKGTANRWAPTSRCGWRSGRLTPAGASPWPFTARWCGLR